MIIEEVVKSIVIRLDRMCSPASHRHGDWHGRCHGMVVTDEPELDARGKLGG